MPEGLWQPGRGEILWPRARALRKVILAPFCSPPRSGGGGEGRGRHSDPAAFALRHITSPLAGLQNGPRD
jgi:hypothetical protein